MRKFLSVFILLIPLSQPVLSQTSNLDKWAVSFTPSFIFSSPVPLYGIQPGAEYRLSSRFTLLTELALGVASKKDAAYSNGRYFRIKPELRYNFEKRFPWLGSYVGLQFSYSFSKWNNLSGGGYFLKTEFDDSCINYKTAIITSPIFTASIVGGKLVKLSDQVFIDLFYGIGFREIFTNYSNVENALKKDSYFRTCSPVNITAAYRIDRTLARFHMNAGIRFLYYF